jgi:hypothetical protein
MTMNPRSLTTTVEDIKEAFQVTAISLQNLSHAHCAEGRIMETTENMGSWKLHKPATRKQFDVVFRPGKLGMISFLSKFLRAHPELEITRFVTVYSDFEEGKIGFEFHGRTDDKNAYTLQWRGTEMTFSSMILARTRVLLPLADKTLEGRRFQLQREENVKVGDQVVAVLYTTKIPA